MSKQFIFGAALTSLAFFLTACQQTPRPEVTGGGAAPIGVRIVIVAPSDVPLLYTATGTVRARVASAIASQTMGYVRAVNVREGEHVAAGQTLVVLDARDVDASYSSASAGREEARSALGEAESAVSAAKANLDLAQATFQRMKELFDKRSISDQEFDEATAKRKAAQADYDVAVARRAQAKDRITRSDADVQGAAVARGYTRIGAPFAGFITTKDVEPGVLALPGTPLLTIEREGGYRLEAAVEESRISAIHLGMKASVTLDSVSQPLAGTVSEIAPVADASSRSYTVKIDLPATAGVRSGVFGRASFAAGDRKVLLIPAAALVEHGQLQSVLVEEDGIAHSRLVSAGDVRGAQVEILSGLQSGDKLIYPIPDGLADGAKVEVRP